MAKVGVKKQIIKKSIPKKTIPKTNQTEKILIENFVALQKVIVNLAEKLTNLSTQTSKLLELFETSAKTLAEKGFEDNKEIVQKLDALLDQNKVLAKGISLLHEAEEEIPKTPLQRPATPTQKPIPQQLPKSPMPPQPSQSQKQAPINIQEYQKSISAP
jgi:hypothetical protein